MSLSWSCIDDENKLDGNVLNSKLRVDGIIKTIKKIIKTCPYCKLKEITEWKSNSSINRVMESILGH